MLRPKDTLIGKGVTQADRPDCVAAKLVEEEWQDRGFYLNPRGVRTFENSCLKVVFRQDENPNIWNVEITKNMGSREPVYYYGINCQSGLHNDFETETYLW